MEKVAFVIPYFGKLHNYFGLFLDSCRANETVDFIFVSDIEDFPVLPSNCKRIKMSFLGLSSKIKTILGFETALTRIYKIVDFKPMWGDVFQDELQGYDYWGFCDCDMILGDLRSFFEQIELGRYDKIFCHGHMTILKNDETLRHLYKAKGGFEKEGVFNYEEAFRTKCIVHFDEGGGFTEICKHLNVKTYENVDYADISFSHKRFILAQPIATASYPCIFTYAPKSLSRVLYKDGEIFDHPVLYVHLQKRKMKIDIFPETEKYHIVPNRFVESSEISVKYILKNAQDGPCWSEYKRRVKQVIFRLSPARLQITLRNKRIGRMDKKYMKRIMTTLKGRIGYLVGSRYLEKISHTKLHSHRASLNASYGRNVSIGRRSIIADDVKIGDHTYINEGTSVENAVIGKYCSISGGVKINPGEHHLDRITTYPVEHLFGVPEIYFNEKVIIGNDVLISTDAIILQGVHIHDGAVIGAGAVVTKDVPAYAIVGGVPAKVIRYRFTSEMIEKLLDLRWWDWSEEKIRSHKMSFLKKIDHEDILLKKR